jgi:hypothetical protein
MLIMHASSEDGFVASTYLCFKSHLISGDCYSMISYEQC